MDSTTRFTVPALGILMFAAGALAAASTQAAASGIDAATAIVASRGGVDLTVADVDAKVRSMPDEMQAGYLLDVDRMARLVDTMLLTKQIAAEGEKRRLHETPEFVGDLQILRTELLSRAEIARHMAEFEVPQVEQLAREQYLGSREKYRPETQIDVRHVLITTSARSDEQAKQLARDVLARAHAGEDFVALAAEYSPSPDGIDRSLIKNPDTSRLDLGFAAALASLEKVGDLVGPVRSPFGYHVIRLERLEKFEVPPFEELKSEIVAELREQAIAAERARFLRSYSRAEFELNDEVIQALPARYAGLVDETAEPGVTADLDAGSSTGSDSATGVPTADDSSGAVGTD